MTSDVSSQDRTTARRTWLGPKIYVEQGENTTVVSWPGGHKVVTPDALLLVLADAIEDTYHPEPPVRYKPHHFVGTPGLWQSSESK